MTRPVLTAAPPRTTRPLPPGRTTTYRHGRVVHRRTRRTRWPVALLVLAAVVGTAALHRDPSAPAIDWPTQGQAAYTTSQLHSLRTSSDDATPAPIASVTKVMTAYVVLHDEPLEPGDDGPSLRLTKADVADTARRKADGESVVAVEAGERISERQALQALLLPSANNIAVVLARWSAGSVDDFVDRMNDAADDLGLDDTVYTDPSGMDERSVSTAADQVVLFDAAMADPVFAAVAGAAEAEIPVAGTVRTTDALLGEDGFVAGKTGSHDAAGGCFVFRVEREVDGRRVTITGAVLGQRDGPFIAAGLTAAQALADEVVASGDVR